MRSGRLSRWCALLVGTLLMSGTSGCSISGATGLDRSGYVGVDDARMYLLVRGANARAPVLLWLHGGPGGAERPLFRYFNGSLEKQFVVAYWDQRGAGRSFDRAADTTRLTIAQHEADLDAVVEHLRHTLAADRIILVGHSWGAALGLMYAQHFPDKIAALVAVNPLISVRAAQQAAFDFVMSEASRRHDHETLREARTVGSPPFPTSHAVLQMEKLVQRFGGVYHRPPSRLLMSLRGIVTGLVSPSEIRRIIQGNQVSLSAMHRELLDLDLSSTVSALQVPVVFMLGRYDRQLDATFSASFFERLRAPAKRLVWFEQSAHNVPFEEPTLFNATVIGELAALVAASTM